MNFEQAKAIRAELDAKNQADSDRIRSFPAGGPFGLTPDSIKATPEWQAAYRAYHASFKALRDFNMKFTKTFAKELRAERNAKRKIYQGA